ncbi:MAG: hypothetical protein COT84_03575 [Chlamydiae bacterium CG10_big_fil_rev_8_21_14_0_10_35_9]|nr:MAG: hypothetical protein COT84_03575 [Chlamydiae bacterium CG10_big_fil_rev_8_21_14_0_10_35_9]
MKTILATAFPLFLMMDPIGNIPLYISFLKDVDPKRQRFIIFRELLIALAIIILFNFLGEGLFNFLKVSQDSIQITGGIILFLIAIKMVFPTDKSTQEFDSSQEPFIVPLAVPLVAGPSILAAVMLYSQQIENHLIMVSSIFLAWGLTLAILIFSPLLSRILGQKGIKACERLMGLILVIIGVQMFLEGVAGFVTHKCIITN